MEPSNVNDAYLLLGRVEGKVDTLISIHSAQGQRLDAVEGRMAQNERDIAALQTKGSTRQSILSNTIALVALGLSAVGAYFGVKLD